MRAFVSVAACFACVFVSVVAHAYYPPKTQPWTGPNGVSLNVPVGWQVGSRRWAGGVLVEISSADKLFIVFVHPGPQGPAERIRDLLQGLRASPLPPANTRTSPSGHVALLGKTKMSFRNQQHIGTALAMGTKQGGLTAVFIARPLSFTLNGGEKMLAAVLPMGQALLDQGPSALLPQLAGGSWTNVTSGGYAQRVANGHVVGEDGHGSGTKLELNPDRTYRYTFIAHITTGGCRSKNEMQEIGAWTLTGAELTLTPTAHDGHICACCRPGQTGQRIRGRGPARTYALRSTQGKRANFVMHGGCAVFDHRPHCGTGKTYDYYYTR